MDNVKIIVVGPPASGKTSIVRRFVYNWFNDTYFVSVGDTIWEADKIVDNKKVHFSIWDIAGDEKWQIYDGLFYRDVDGVFLVFDLTRPETLWDLEQWSRKIDEKCNTHPIRLLLGNKADLVNGDFDESIIKTAMNQYRIRAFFKTSAKTGLNIDKAFYFVVRELWAGMQYVKMR